MNGWNFCFKFKFETDSIDIYSAFSYDLLFSVPISMPIVGGNLLLRNSILFASDLYYIHLIQFQLGEYSRIRERNY